MGTLEAAKIPPKEYLRSKKRPITLIPEIPPPTSPPLYSTQCGTRTTTLFECHPIKGVFSSACAFNSTARRNRSTGTNESKMLIIFFLNLQLRFPWGFFFGFVQIPRGVVKRNGCQFGRQVAPRDDNLVGSSARFKNRKTHRWIRPTEQTDGPKNTHTHR